MKYDTTSVPAMPGGVEAFELIAVEDEGGGRIVDKKDPAASDLVDVRGRGGRIRKLHRLAAQALVAMVSEARSDGFDAPLLSLVSGYRSTEHQRKLWRRALKKYGSAEKARKWVAKPGGSPHHSGRAVDLYMGIANDSGNVGDMRDTAVHEWLVENAERFGFYPYQAEPWHWEYNPPADGAPSAAEAGGTSAQEQQRVLALPLSDPETVSVSEDTLEQYFEDAETAAGGWYPIGASQTWHNGIHLVRPRHQVVRAVVPGRIVAARYASNDDLGDFKFGSPGFVLVQHALNIPARPEGPVMGVVQEALPYKKQLGDAEAAGTLGVGETLVFTGEQGMNFLPADDPDEDGQFAGSWLSAESAVHRAEVWVSIDQVERLSGTRNRSVAVIATEEDEDEESGTKGLNCRATPGGTVLGVLPKGTEVELYAITQGNWQVVRAPDQGISGGWVYNAGGRLETPEANDTSHTFYSLYMNVAFEPEDRSQEPIPWIVPYLPHLQDEKPQDAAELARLTQAVELDDFDVTLPEGTVVWWAGPFDEDHDLISPPSKADEVVIFAPVPKAALKQIATTYEYGRVVTDEDAGGLNCRSFPDTDYSHASELGVIPEGTYVKMYDASVEAGGWTWRVVSAPEHGIEYGWITTAHEKEGVADNALVPEDLAKVAAELKKGGCVKLDVPAEAGEAIANTGLLHPANITGRDLDAYGVHLEFFAEENVLTDAHMKHGEWRTVEDDSDQDIICESKTAIAQLAGTLDEEDPAGAALKRLGWGGSEAVDVDDMEELRETVAENLPALRRLITRNTSYWAVNWGQVRAQNPDWAREFAFTADDAKAAQKYVWWQPVQDAGAELPAEPLVYHYHPIALIEYLNDQDLRTTALAGGALNLDTKMRMVRIVASFESGRSPYTACNRDYEFEGRFDLPKRWYKDKTKAKPDKINPRVDYSKYSDNPRHVGLSFGLIQFTQESSLGDLVALMHEKDATQFEQTFGPHHEELLETLQKTGAYTKSSEEVFDNTGASMGTKKVRRRPSVQPVTGHEVWDDYWVERFKASGRVEVFQQCQEELAVSAYLDPILNELKGRTVSEKSLCCLYDRSVNEGVGGAKSRYLDGFKKATDEKAFWEKMAKKKGGDIGRRLKHIINSGEISWETVYEI